MIRFPHSPRRSRRAGLLAASLFIAVCSVAGQAAAKDQNSITAYGGAYGVNAGLEDRLFGGINVALQRGDKKFDGELSTIDREEDATFAAVGFSWDAGADRRARVSVGTSTENENIAPDVLLAGSVTFGSEQPHSWAITPSATYRHYRSEEWETTVAAEGVRYTDLDGDKDGYYVFQVRAAVAPNSSDQVGYSASAGVTTVRNNGLSLGVSVEVGRSQYDTQQGLATRSDFVAVRPMIGFRLSTNTEVFARGEFADVDTYDVQGATIGVKTTF